jgi:drug/metabolite transporter (DMT)-like permease
MSGSVFLILALLSLSGLGICHKVADFHRCKPSAVSMILFAAAASVLWSYTLFYKVLGAHVGLFPPFTGKAVAVALFCGACAGIAILTFQVGVRYGRISTSWLVINLSTIVPAVLSLIIYREWEAGLKWQQIAGLGLIVVSIVLLWLDKTKEVAQPGHAAEISEFIAKEV